MRILCVIFIALTASLGKAQLWPEVQALFKGNMGFSNDGSSLVSILRSDLQIQSSSGMLIPPEMGLESYAIFSGNPKACQVSGEICMIQTEINPVLDDLLAGGMEVESLGGRLSGEQPSVYFLRFRGGVLSGKVAATLRRALDELGKDRFTSE